MNSIHLHLLLNHVPVIGAVLGLALLGVAFLRHSDELGKVALGAFAVLGAVSVIVFLTGEPAEELVEKLPGFSKALTERHEEAALAATIVMGIVGFLSLAGLVVFRSRALAWWVVPTAFGLALCATATMGYAANLGGQIRHTEIRAGAVPAGENPERGERAER
jgi:uncharacterized membrane protein